MMIKIVKMNKTHINAASRIGKSVWPDYNFMSKKFIENALQRAGVHLVAIEYGKVVGCIMVEIQDAPRSWIYYFVVDSKHQRKGIGTKLLKNSELKTKKGSFLFVDVGEIDKSGINFYKKNGFKTAGVVKNWFEKGEKGIIMAKRIDR